MPGNALFDVNKFSTIFAVTILASITPAAAVLGPLIVGALVTNLSFTAEQAGYIIGAELIGAGLSTLLVLLIVAKINWQSILYCALGVIVVGNLLSAMVSDFTQLLALRLVVGLAVGTVMVKTLVVVGMTANQQRVMGYWSLGQVAFSVIAFAALPHVLPVMGMAGLYLGLAGASALMLVLVQFMPPEGSSDHKLGFKSLSPEVRKLAPIGLIALLMFFTGLSGVWSYVERMGNTAGFAATNIGYILSIASIFGVVGASTATFVSSRFGLLAPSIMGYVSIVFAIALLFGLKSESIYSISSFAFKFSWWFMLPYLLANMTLLDGSGHLIILTNFVIGVGVGVGPAIAGYLLSHSQAIPGAALDFAPVLTMGIFCMIASCVLLLPVIRANANKKLVLTAAH